jgi:C4-type Zn-finger protein
MKKEKEFLIFCGHCGKQCKIPVKNSKILGFIANTTCENCGNPLANIQWKENKND